MNIPSLELLGNYGPLIAILLVHLIENPFLVDSPLVVDDMRVEVVVIPACGGMVPLAALLARPAGKGELLLHYPCDGGPLALPSLLPEES